MNSFYNDEELKEIGFKSLGQNVLISKKTSIYGASNIEIGNNVRIDDFSILSGHIKIGNFVHIAAGVYLFGGEPGIIFEDYTGISSRSAIYAVTDDYSGEYMSNPTVPDEYKKVFGGPVVLKKHVLVGSGCTILPNVTLGEGTSVGSMSLIHKNLDPYMMYVGIPAKPLKERKRRILELEKQLINEFPNDLK